MSAFESTSLSRGGGSSLRGRLAAGGVCQLVIVDSSCEQHTEFVQAAQAGLVGLHFCTDGKSALRLCRRFRAAAWLVAVDLADMSGFDLLEMLIPTMLHAGVKPARPGPAAAVDRLGEPPRSAVFLVADDYRMVDEQRALASGVAGYLVRPVTLDVIAGALAAGGC